MNSSLENRAIKRLKIFLSTCVKSSLNAPDPNDRIGAILCMEKWGRRDMHFLGMACSDMQDCETAKAAARLSIFRINNTNQAISQWEIQGYMIPFLKSVIGSLYAEDAATKAQELLDETLDESKTIVH